MRKRILTTGAVLSVVMLTGCAGDAGVDADLDIPDTIEVPDTIVVPDAIDVPDLAQIEADLVRMGEEVNASAAQAELTTAWAGVEAEMRAAIESVRSGAMVDTDAIQQQFDEFQQTIDTAEVESTLQETWTQVRAEFDRLMASTNN